ncbi:MAG: penicillin-binding protein [Flavobacteriales bacterium AspAUS03]
MSQPRRYILYKAYLIGLGLFLFALAIAFKLLRIQTSPKKKEYEKFAQETTICINPIKARRGNVYDINGNLLATSIARYDIRVDLKAIPERLFKANINALCDSLGGLFKKPQSYFYQILQHERQHNNRYFLLAKGLDYPEFKVLRQFPIFNRGQIRGGFIVERRTLRIHPLENIGNRTIGYDDQRGKAGLEGAFGEFLRGQDGQRLEQRISAKVWKPLNNWNEIEPEDGKDLYATIDITLQDVVYNALVEQLIASDAAHGCAVLMEVKSGEIHAMVNLKKMRLNIYEDLRNFAAWEASEPGSTFKTMALLVALEDQKIDTNTLVNTGNGVFVFKGRRILDSHHDGYGTIDIKRVLEISSNVGMAKLIYENYKDQPKQFICRLHDWGLDQKLRLDIPGEGIPFIPRPGEKYWNNLTLSWMAFGYNLKLTPLQILTFYNAIANDGKLVKPLFIKEIRYQGQSIKTYEPVTLKASIASEASLKKIQTMLKGVVKNGTAKKIYHPDYPYAGKTGTAQLEYWIKGRPLTYNSSFVGYFPATSPQYSCIVVIAKPKKGYYGSDIAAPVFDRIAQAIYPKILRRVASRRSHAGLFKSICRTKNFPIITDQIHMPNVTGISGKEVIPALENRGLIVRYQGLGKVIDQSIPEGALFRRGQTILLTLEE